MYFICNFICNDDMKFTIPFDDPPSNLDGSFLGFLECTATNSYSEYIDWDGFDRWNLDESESYCPSLHRIPNDPKSTSNVSKERAFHFLVLKISSTKESILHLVIAFHWWDSLNHQN